MGHYVVTGGCGFIGSHLADALLAEDHNVTIIDDLSSGKRENVSPRAEIIVGDVADHALMQACLARADGCFHLAAVASVQRSVEDWLGTHRANLTGTIAVLDAASHRPGRSPCPVVFASSAAVYGAGCDNALAETARIAPLSAYGADKYGCELHGAIASHLFATPVTALRFFNVYGPRQDSSSPYSGVMSIFAARIRAGRAITIFGDGLQSRDFVYVADIVRFLRAAMSHRQPRFRVYNVCSGHAVTLLDVAQAMSRIVGYRPTIEHEPARAGDIRHSLGVPDLAAHELGIATEVGLENGLAALLANADVR